METNQSVKAKLAITTLILGMLFINIPNAKALTYKSFETEIPKIETKVMEDKVSASLEKLEIKPLNIKLHSKKTSSVELKINVEELRQIKNARKKALELQKQKEEEEKRKQEELRLAEEKKQTEEKTKAVTSLSYDELVAKLNRSLNSDLTGKGDTFAKYAINLGIDPYLAVAIVLHETGCQWQCSTLLKQCNNVGGMKGSPGCNGGSYKAFSTLDEGIEAYMNNLYNNYISQGLTTPEAMGSKYAASSTWAAKVRAYMNQIEAR